MLHNSKVFALVALAVVLAVAAAACAPAPTPAPTAAPPTAAPALERDGPIGRGSQEGRATDDDRTAARLVRLRRCHYRI